jgi:hypothetical protein
MTISYFEGVMQAGIKRMISGIAYRETKWYSRKREAQQTAIYAREQGYKARVIEKDGGYIVAVRR